MDRNGAEVKVGDKVHYFGWHNMKPVGVIEAIVHDQDRDIAMVRPILSKKPGDVQRVSNDIEKVQVQQRTW